MSLALTLGSSPAGMVAGMWNAERNVLLSITVPMQVGRGEQRDLSITFDPRDFAELVKYWLTNTDLEKDDPRIGLIQALATLGSVPGFNHGQQRYAFDWTPAAPEAADAYQPTPPKPYSGIKEELRVLPGGEQCYSGKFLDQIADAIRRKDAHAKVLLLEAVRPLVIDPSPNIDVDSLRLTGHGDPGSRGIAFQFLA